MTLVHKLHGYQQGGFRRVGQTAARVTGKNYRDRTQRTAANVKQKTMKTLLDGNSNSDRSTLQTRPLSMAGWMLLFSLLAASCTTPVNAQQLSVHVSFHVPGWAPSYANAERVRYYYFPDIECYYDARTAEYIYLDNGRWIFSRLLPPWYEWFDPSTAFVIALNYRVFEPWRHFHYYVAHYPRYYYKSFRPDRHKHYEGIARGYNENDRNMLFRPQGREEEGFRRNDNRPMDGRDRQLAVPPANDRGRDRQQAVPEINRDRNNNQNRSQEREVSRNNGPQQSMPTINRENNRQEPARQAAPSGRSEEVKYYGREVGRPVHVNRNMRERQETKTREGKTARER